LSGIYILISWNFLRAEGQSYSTVAHSFGRNFEFRKVLCFIILEKSDRIVANSSASKRPEGEGTKKGRLQGLLI